MQPTRFLLPSVVAMLALGAIDAQASLLQEMRQVIDLEKSGRATQVVLTKHRVEVTVEENGSEERYSTTVRGAKERKQVRYASWQLQLAGDRAEMFEKAGAPTYRTRENFAGVLTERWTYASRHVTYVFQGDRLVDTESF
ncbi:MAG TPA: hypothetical protein VFD07_00970 [Candidatus Krumholzibacteria bacterium]|nr:hypothetical protein [Candidatus Krumholzibacteria bacterium]